MTQKNLEKWVLALRSGKYNQTTGTLQSTEGFCCLGVACDIFIPEDKKDVFTSLGIKGIMKSVMPEDQPHAPKWLLRLIENFVRKTRVDLASLNDGVKFIALQTDVVGLPDGTKFTFDEIADLLELVYIHKALN